MGIRMPDLVFAELDGSAPEVLDVDGFWATKGCTGWSEDRPTAVPGVDPDRIPVTDSVVASKLSNEARA